MLSVRTIPMGFSTGECALLRAMAAAMPVADAGLVRQNRDHNLRRADLVCPVWSGRTALRFADRAGRQLYVTCPVRLLGPAAKQQT